MFGVSRPLGQVVLSATTRSSQKIELLGASQSFADSRVACEDVRKEEVFESNRSRDRVPGRGHFMTQVARGIRAVVIHPTVRRRASIVQFLYSKACWRSGAFSCSLSRNSHNSSRACGI